MIGDFKEVYFDKYCESCKNSEDSEFDVNSSCFECLEQFTNQDSHKPVNYKEDDEPKKPKKK